jgi:hypothetical protein
MILDLVTFLAMLGFYIKLLAIVIAAVNTRLLGNQLFNDFQVSETNRVPGKAQIFAGLALTSWAVAITAGRVTAYIGWIQRQSAIAALIFALLMLTGGYFALLIAVP